MELAASAPAHSVDIIAGASVTAATTMAATRICLNDSEPHKQVIPQLSIESSTDQVSFPGPASPNPDATIEQLPQCETGKSHAFGQ